MGILILISVIRFILKSNDLNKVNNKKKSIYLIIFIKFNN